MPFFRLLPALVAFTLLGPVPAFAEGERIVLLEDPALTDNRLHYPLLLSNERGYRLRCATQQDEEAIIHGLGFATVPSQILAATDPDVVIADPLSNPLLCPSASDYEIKIFAHNAADGLMHYLQFPGGFGSAVYTDRIYIPGCAGLVEALKLNLDQALNADPTPFFSGKIHEIGCLTGAPISVKPKTFAAWCMKGDRTEAETATVMALLDATPVGISALGEAAACEDADQFLGVINSLNLNGTGVQSLEPLSVLRHLTNLSLAGNEIANLSPLTKLNALTFLNLSGNNITNVAALAPLAALASLNLSENDIEDIRALSALATLSSLNLDGNDTQDLEPLQFLQALTTLSLAGNELTGEMLEPLTGLGALTSLDLSVNNIESFEHLGEFPSTLQINLSGNPIVASGGQSFLDICILHRDAATPLGQTIRALIETNGSGTCAAANGALHASSSLDLSGRVISNLQPLGTLTHLTNLNLSGNAITDVAPLLRLTGLVDLNLADNDITDIRPISPLVSLTAFDASNNPVSVADYLSACLMRNHEGALTEPQLAEVNALYDIGGRQSCHQSNEALRQLQSANMQGLGLASLSYVGVMKNLRSIDLSNNTLTDLSALSDNGRLTSLAARSNQITAMSALTALRGLEVLAIDGNPLQSLNGIANLSKLRRVYFSDTAVRFILPLASLPELADAGMRNVDIIYQSVKEYCLVHKFDSVALGAIRQFMVALDSRIDAANVDRTDCDAVDIWAREVEHLNLNKKSIKSVAPIRFFVSLRELHLFDNHITDAGPIASLRELEKLSLARNLLNSVPRLSSTGLRTLYVSENRLTSLGNLTNLTALKTLNAMENRIANPVPVAGIGSLEYVDLRNNRITQLSAITPLLAKKPYLKGNPVCQLRIGLPGFSDACTRDPRFVVATDLDLDIGVIVVPITPIVPINP